MYRCYLRLQANPPSMLLLFQPQLLRQNLWARWALWGLWALWGRDCL